MTAQERGVSVVIPAREAAATISRALDSVLAQDPPPLEMIVVDDASRDATAAIVAGYAAHGVRLLHLDEPAGAAAARNAGIDAAAGNLVAFQDADDEWLPGKLARQLEVLDSDPRIAFVACDCRLIAADGHDLGPLYGGQVPAAGPAAWRGLLARNTIATPSVLVRRMALLEAGGFDPTLPVAEDQDMWIRLALHGHLGYVDAPLVRVHVTSGSLSGVGSPGGCHQQIAVTLPMVRRHLAAMEGSLSAAERRAILGERLGRIGRTAYASGLHLEGLRMIAQASLLGFRPVGNLWFLAHAAPPSRWLKRRLLRHH